MVQRHGMSRLACAATALAFGLVTIVPAGAEQVILKKGTEVHLVFDTSLNSDTARPGDMAKLHVEDPVTVDGQTVIAEGTEATGTVVKVKHRGRFGTNAKIQLEMANIKTVSGKRVPLGFHSKGQDVSSRTGEAAGASVGSAIVLGPVGLVAGYFIPGKKVNIKPGDKMTVTVDKDTILDVK